MQAECEKEKHWALNGTFASHIVAEKNGRCLKPNEYGGRRINYICMPNPVSDYRIRP